MKKVRIIDPLPGEEGVGLLIGQIGEDEFRIAIQGHVRSYGREDFGFVHDWRTWARPIAYLITSAAGGAIGAAVAWWLRHRF